MFPHVRPGGLVAGARCCQPAAEVQAHVSEAVPPRRVPRRMNSWLALSYASEARTSAGADAAGVIAGAPHALVVGVGDGLAEGFAEGMLDAVAKGLVTGIGVGLPIASGLDPHATEARSTTAAREASRLAIWRRLCGLAGQLCSRLFATWG